MLLSLHFPGHYRSPRHMQSSCSMPHNARENPGSRLEGNSSKATSLQLLPRRTLGRIFNWPEAERVRKAESLFSSSLKRSHATGLQDSNVWTNNGDVALCINLESTRGQEDRFEYFPQQFCPLANPHVSLNEGKMTSNKPVHTNGQSHRQIILIQCATSTLTRHGGRCPG
ncbi:uncharacterized protein LOC119129529 isoform X6 [Syngnathus acus]|uniref:uncharacterized protein LOC119129529 isoform X6 n=1 Tax=Syngnathus acus TaxID=161584 RepID=UPI0018863528|nr:uncharacterized protein LOC119129529 isoform X6 [Syngnathus acus]